MLQIALPLATNGAVAGLSCRQADGCLQADREALQLRRKLLTRLLQEAKAAWLQLRPREEAIRRALGRSHAGGAALEPQPGVSVDSEAAPAALNAIAPPENIGEAPVQNNLSLFAAGIHVPYGCWTSCVRRQTFCVRL
jgi:hypothetical protein